MEEGCKRPNWPFKRHHQSSTKAARLLLDDPSKGLLFLGLLEVSYQVGVESNWNLFEIRSIRFKNLRFERAKNILKIR